MKTFPLILFLVLFIGCQSHPKAGDWYEHKGTRERVQVSDVETWKFHYEVGTNYVNTGNKISWDVYKIKEMHSLDCDKEDSLKECINFITFRNTRGYNFSTFHIISMEKLKQNYQLIE